MRFLLRLLSACTLLAAIGFAAVDAVRFVAVASFKLVTVATALASAGYEPSQGAGDVTGLVLSLPAVAVLLSLSLVLWLAGYRRPRPFVPFAVAKTRSHGG